MPENLSTVLLAGLVIALVVLIYQFASARQHKQTIAQLQQEIEVRAKQQLENWRLQEIEAIRQEQRDIALREARVTLEGWKVENETYIRSDAIGRSQSVIVGKVTEHIVPYLPQFRFNPKDTRFMGSPLDLLVFDGLDEGELRDIYFVEVKTGASAALTTRQRQIRDAILSGRVRWIELRMERPS